MCLTTPSDSCPRMEVSFLSLSAISLPLMSLCPFTHARYVSCELFSRVSRACWILASIDDRGASVPESPISPVCSQIARPCLCLSRCVFPAPGDPFEFSVRVGGLGAQVLAPRPVWLSVFVQPVCNWVGTESACRLVV